MNPLGSPKCAGRFLAASALIPSILLIAGCGSSSSPSPNSSGYSNSNLSGTYVLSISGTDVNASANTESFFAIVGTMTTDGKGNITGGTVDINDSDLGGSGVFTAQALSASTYSITSDGRGTGKLVTPQGTFAIDFVLTSNSHGLITRFDTNGTGSGTLDAQGTAAQSSLTSLAFSLAGADASQNPFGSVGAFTLNSSGTITTGLQDFNDKGSSAASGLSGLPLSGSLVVASSGTTGTATLTTSGYGSPTFDVWVIDSSHLKLIETDTSGLALAGDVYTQQTTFTPGQLVFTVAGEDISDDPIAAGGYVTTDANGNLSAGIEDYNNAGTTNTVQDFTASCSTFSGGRCQWATTGFTNGKAANLQFAAYPSSGGVLMLEDDSAGLAQGAAYAQSATAFAVPLGYGLNLSGVNADAEGSGEVDDIAQFDATSTAAPATNMTGIVDENSILGGPILSKSLTGYYTPDSPVDGRGSMTITTPGTFIGGLTLQYYVVNASTALFIEVDADQLSIGTFEAQAAQSGQMQSQQVPQSRITIVHPAVRRAPGAWNGSQSGTHFAK